MPKSDSTSSEFAHKPQKSSKPHVDFPLYAHATRRWAKRIRGVIHYFGPRDDPDGALKSISNRKTLYTPAVSPVRLRRRHGQSPRQRVPEPQEGPP